MDRIKSITSVYLLSLLVALACGCQPSDSTNGLPGSQSSGNAAAANDGVPADQILTLMQAVYANAASYRDDAVLMLSYRKDGLLTEEPQRWSTAWTADGKLAMEVFGAHLKGDGQRLSCYIYDIDTANLDGQRMVVPYENGQPPVSRVFRDPMARVFLGGYSELPLNEVDKSLREKLVPAPLSLLTGQLPCVWLQNPSGVERLPDAKLGDHECYVIRSLAEGLGCDIWIDKSSGLLVQMSLPLKLLDPEVMAAPNITDLRMLARFENASISTAIDPVTFQLQPRKNSTPVQSFVTLPQSLPVESIGQVMDRLRLIQPNGNPVDHLHFDGKPTALLWLGGEKSYAAIKQLNRLTERLPRDQFNFGIIYSDSELVGTPAQPHLVRPELTAATASSDIPLFYDPRLAASIELAVRDIPSVVLLDGDSRVQFATAVTGDAWDNELEAAMERVANGENLAEEMLAQYQDFMTRYKSALGRVDATNVLPSELRDGAAVKSGLANPTIASTLPKRNSPASLQPRQIWTSEKFYQPGNIAVIGRSQPTILVLDGARTIVELDQTGGTIDRQELELPDRVAVSKIRVSKDGRWRALFSTLSKRAYLFDSSWKLVRAMPDSKSAVAGLVNDVQVMINPPNETSLLLATNGGEAISVDLGSSTIHSLVGFDADSFAVHNGSAVIVNGGKLQSRSIESTASSSDSQSRLRFVRVVNLSAADTETFVATGFDGQQWQAFGCGIDLKRRWTSPIGSQLFESLIDPVTPVAWNDQPAKSRTQDPNSVGFAIASTGNAVHTFASDGRWLADVRLDGTPTGVGLFQLDGKSFLLTSVGNSVQCWLLE